MTDPYAAALPPRSDAFPAARGYLGTATYGLAPREAVHDTVAFLERAARGDAAMSEMDAPVDQCRALVARLLGVPPSRVSVGSAVSSVVGMVAASVPRGTRVVVPQDEFSSVVFPFATRARSGDLELVTVPLCDVAEAIDGRTSWVALSNVQSACGTVADLAAVRAAADAHGCRVLVDATQGLGWLPTGGNDADVVVAGGYKWLLGAKGTCYTAVQPALYEVLPLLAPGWWASEHRTVLYGGDLRLAAGARRFDTAPAWLAYAASVAGLRLINSIGPSAVYAHDVALARRFAEAVGLPDPSSAIVSVEAPANAMDALREAGITASMRAGRVRLAFHLYNDEHDADMAADVLSAFRLGQTAALVASK